MLRYSLTACNDAGSKALLEALQDPLHGIVSAVKTALEQTPPELGADVAERGIVLTGGAAKMEGVIDLAEEIFHMPVSLGSPRNVAGLKDIVQNPIYATGVGLLLYGLEREAENPTGARSGGGLGARIKRWFGDNF